MTVINYRKDLTEFERFYKELEPQLSWESIDSDIVRNWMEYMMDRGNSASSVNRRLSALRSFYRFALRRKLIEKDINKYIVDFKGLIKGIEHDRSSSGQTVFIEPLSIVSLNNKMRELETKERTKASLYMVSLLRPT